MLYVLRFRESGRDAQRGTARTDLRAVLTARLPGATLVDAPGRLLCECPCDATPVLRELFGLTSWSPCERVPLDATARALGERLAAHAACLPATTSSFAVTVTGIADASLALSRSALARALGAQVRAVMPHARVDLARPQARFGVELRGATALVFSTSVPGREHIATPALAGERRFLVDRMLGRLVAHLRLCGFDTRYASADGEADSALLRTCSEEGRILVTQDAALAAVRAVPVVKVRARDPAAQLREVCTVLQLHLDATRWYTRCARCNEPVRPAAAADIARLVPPIARRAYASFSYCARCDKAYWRGAHAIRLERAFGRASAS
jgi:uncharacterized protein with PIN domain